MDEAEEKISALYTMKSVSAAVETISTKKAGGQSSFYHLIVLDSITRTVQITPYDRGSIDVAMRDYAEVETRAAQGDKIEPVLVAAGPMDKLRRAYPSFFLDIQGFVNLVSSMIPRAKQPVSEESQRLSQERRNKLKELLTESLEPIEKSVVVLLYYEEKTYAQIAQALDISEERVAEIHRAIVKMLKDQSRGEGSKG